MKDMKVEATEYIVVAESSNGRKATFILETQGGMDMGKAEEEAALIMGLQGERPMVTFFTATAHESEQERPYIYCVFHDESTDTKIASIMSKEDGADWAGGLLKTQKEKGNLTLGFMKEITEKEYGTMENKEGR